MSRNLREMQADEALRELEETEFPPYVLNRIVRTRDVRRKSAKRRAPHSERAALTTNAPRQTL